MTPAAKVPALESAIAEAQHAGFAEANPKADLSVRIPVMVTGGSDLS